jgi:hypothetical protein
VFPVRYELHFYVLFIKKKLYISHVEAVKNTSTLIPDSRKRRRKGNSVFSDETVMYGYESSATLTTDTLHYKFQTSPLVREGTPRQRPKQLFSKRKEKKNNLVMGLQSGAGHQG